VEAFRTVSIAMLIDELERLIVRKPGLTATQIAAELYGADGYGERVRGACWTLVERGRIERRGVGGPCDPFTYHPVSHN
jgi:hypothetical protein